MSIKVEFVKKTRPHFLCIYSLGTDGGGGRVATGRVVATNSEEWRTISSISKPPYLRNGDSTRVMTRHTTVKEETFVGEKIRIFPPKTFRMEFNFVLSESLKEVKTRRDDQKSASQVEENLVWKLISYFCSVIRKIQN